MKGMKKSSLVCILSYMGISSIYAQLDQSVRFSQETIAFINENKGKNGSIPAIHLDKQSDLDLSIKFHVNGFSDRTYQIKATVLDRDQKPLREITCAPKDVDTRKDTLYLKFDGTRLKKSKRPAVISEFIKLSVTNVNTGLSDYTDRTSEDVFLFPVRKIWLSRSLPKS